MLFKALKEKHMHNEPKCACFVYCSGKLECMKRLLSFILIVSTLALFWNNAVNWHYHQLPNGIVVEHAHPYSKSASSPGSPFEKHHHSDFEYLILDLVYHGTLVILMVVLTLMVYRQLLTHHTLLKLPERVIGSYYNLPLLRGPPLV